MKNDVALDELEVRDLDHLELMSKLWDELGFDAIVAETIPVDDQIQLRPEKALKGLCLNVLHGREPLYRVAQFFHSVPTDLLLGDEVRPEHLNDDALGRHLDRLFDADGAKLYSAMSLRVIAHEGLSVAELHGDTTSKLVFGEYVRGHEEAVSVTRGHSKDHRPDLKQVMAGLTTTPDGVPVAAEMLSGNQSDKTWYGVVLEKLRGELQLKPSQRVHFVGDSALITRENLDTAVRVGIELTGRLPRTVAACTELVKKAIARGDWEELGATSKTPEAAEYQGQKFESTVLGHRLQGAVYRSSHPQARADEAVHRRQKKACAEAQKEGKTLMKKSYACEADAEQAKQQFLTKYQESALRIKGTVTRRKVVGRYARRGRPAAQDRRPEKEEIGLDLSVALDSEEVERHATEESCFVLVHLGAAPISAKELLRVYKAQATVETRFPFLKDQNWCDVFFVKQQTRVEALGYVMLISLLLWTIWERRVRRALSASKEAPLKDVTGMTKKRPTAAVCVHIMRGVRVARLSPNEPWRRLGKTTPEQDRVVRLSGVRIN